jgi:hypothetical protein
VRGGAAFPGSPVFIAAAEKKLTTERFKTADATLKAAVEERKIKQTRGESVGKRVGGAVGCATSRRRWCSRCAGGPGAWWRRGGSGRARWRWGPGSPRRSSVRHSLSPAPPTRTFCL